MKQFLILTALTITTIVNAKLPNKPVISAAHPLAITAGYEILAQGGNAFDAAVAVSAVLAVVEPESSGLGGGGFWLLHIAKNNKSIMVDGREQAPAAAHRDMYLDKDGNVDRDLAINGPLSAGIPGNVAAMVHVVEKYGQLTMVQNLAPAIRIAENGFPADDKFVRGLTSKKPIMQRYATSMQTFYIDGKDTPKVGDKIVLKDLAMTLRAIAKQGKAGFYQGKIASKLVNSVQRAGGIWTLKDLKNYNIVEREPIYTTYQGKQLITTPPPSSGGIALATMLNILSAWDLSNMQDDMRIHLTVEAMRRAYRDRSIFLGDPDFVTIPTDRLIHPFYADGLRASIRMDKAMPSSALPGLGEIKQGKHTSHFSIIDTKGNLVATTQTVNTVFGSKFVAAGTGVILNNEMDDFSAKPGEPNAYGLIGGEANSIAPGKRPLSSMTPTFVIGDDDVAVIGTPGGSRIITMVLLGILDYYAGNDVNSWVALPRYHHQYVPDVLYYETGAIDADSVAKLIARGHTLKELKHKWGNMNVAYWNKKTGKSQAATDPRGGKAQR
ncbi:MAG: gamma-glutamyltransferase [Proteobacteria bacterium]|nr:gamma-glutamyltransferase [Pseudomonadota bacterium]